MRSQNDRIKMVRAGWTLLRIVDVVMGEGCKPYIKYTPDGTNWKVWKRFETKAALMREVKRIDVEERMTVFE